VHPDLDTNYVAGYDFVSANDSSSCRAEATNADGDYVAIGTYGALGWDNNPLDPGDWTTVSAGSCRISNSSWHGTHVAGTVGAVANNGQYIAGVAPQAKIQPVRVLSFDGGYTSDIIAAITWASGGAVDGVTTNATPVDVINMSLGGTGSAPPRCKPLSMPQLAAALSWWFPQEIATLTPPRASPQTVWV